MVLAGVHEDLLVLLAQRAGHGGGLDELGPVAHDGEDAHPSQPMRSPGAASAASGPAQPLLLVCTADSVGVDRVDGHAASRRRPRCSSSAWPCSAAEGERDGDLQGYLAGGAEACPPRSASALVKVADWAAEPSVSVHVTEP